MAVRLLNIGFNSLFEMPFGFPLSPYGVYELVKFLLSIRDARVRPEGGGMYIPGIPFQFSIRDA